MKKHWSQLNYRQQQLARQLADQAHELGLELTVSRAGADLVAAIDLVYDARQRTQRAQPVRCPACGQDLPGGCAALVVYEPPPA